jgi:hypothetical protein
MDEDKGSADNKYLGKTAFCMSFGARSPAPFGDILPSASRLPIPPERGMTPAVGKVRFSTPTDFDGTLYPEVVYLTWKLISGSVAGL